MTGPATDYIAGELRAQKSRMKWTLDELVEMSGLARSTIDRAMKGEGGLSVETLIPLAQAMRLDVIALTREAARRSSLGR